MATLKKTSKILLGILGSVMALMVVGLIILNKDLIAYQEAKPNQIRYESVAVGEFEHATFSGSWRVRVRQGREFKLEIGFPDSLRWSSNLSSDTLRLELDTTRDNTIKPIGYARLTSPFLLSIRLDTANELYLDELTQDSLQIFYAQDGTLGGFGNTITHLNVDANGRVLIALEDDPND